VAATHVIETRTDDQLGRPYRVIGPIKAPVIAGHGFNKGRTEDADSKMRETALEMDANRPQCSLRPAFTASWQALTVTGTAVVVESAERTCPFCTEMIMHDAVVCRYCGHEPISVRWAFWTD
jgi:hypothetical protein